MFDRIAPRYDLLNHLLSLGTDHGWRRRAVAAVAPARGERVLDLCCGTGDLALALARAGARVTGADFSAPMLARAARKANRAGREVSLCAADALALPFRDASFDAAAVAFGVRNLAAPLAGLREIRRTLRPGGRLVVLEFARPRAAVLRRLYKVYLRTALPAAGWLVAGSADAYRYLGDSIGNFLDQERFQTLLAEAGYFPEAPVDLSGGIAAVYRARRP
jgi:demethylmenaquinone methyltransferase/2-methoxy-6-polyprenyl-1,4-benzoquinol methylase